MILTLPFSPRHHHASNYFPLKVLFYSYSLKMGMYVLVTMRCFMLLSQQQRCHLQFEMTSVRKGRLSQLSLASLLLLSISLWLQLRPMQFDADSKRPTRFCTLKDQVVFRPAISTLSQILQKNRQNSVKENEDVLFCCSKIQKRCKLGKCHRLPQALKSTF